MPAIGEVPDVTVPWTREIS